MTEEEKLLELDRLRLEEGYTLVIRINEYEYAALYRLLYHWTIRRGLRMVWRRWDWALHNLVAHPLMQIMAWCGMGRQAVRLHDWSTPRPRGVRK